LSFLRNTKNRAKLVVLDCLNTVTQLGLYSAPAKMSEINRVHVKISVQ